MGLLFTVTNLSNQSSSDVQHASSHCETEWPQELYAQLLNGANDHPGHFCGLTCYSFSAAVSLRRAIFSKKVSSLLAHAEELSLMEKVLNRSILSTWREEFTTHVQAAGSIRIQGRNMSREPPPRDGPSCNDRDCSL
jgi:hypothetical protein